jgi:hypothetical protein
MSLPFTVAEILARLFEFLPSPPLTTGRVDLLRADSGLASGAPFSFYAVHARTHTALLNQVCRIIGQADWFS